ncbi:MAG: D-alanyl-D-alanine carboxypeptidase family protein [Roseburia sp.]
MENTEFEEEEARQRRARRRQIMKKKKERQQLVRRLAVRLGFFAVLLVLILVLCVHGMRRLIRSGEDTPDTELATEYFAERIEDTQKEQEETEINEPGTVTVGDVEFAAGYQAVETADTFTIATSDDMQSEYAILIDASTGTIVGEKNAYSRMNPASMTKILTVLVAAEQIEDLDAEVTISQEAVDYSFSNDCSNVGFEVGEKVKVRDLFYGTILSSGADAAYELAVYTAGSQEDFVELMNKKLEELGLSDSAHVTNCVGIYDEDHYCTVYDMAMILKAAVENDWCREVMSAHVYEIPPSEIHPDGLVLSNWFLRRIEDKDTGGEVLCAKTGYVVQSGNCCASYQISSDGTPYLCVTGGASSSWRCIYDQVTIYNLP